jgi:hypothetical protein
MVSSAMLSARTRRIAGALLFLAALASYAWAFDLHLDEMRAMTAGDDFLDYYYTAKVVRKSGASIYDHGAMVRLALREVAGRPPPVFVYPPLLVVVFLPISKLSYENARTLWLVCNQVFLALTMIGLVRIWESRRGTPVKPLFAAVFTLLGAATAPLLDHNWQGQSNLLVVALVTWSLYFHFEEKPASDFWCGAFLAIAILLKLFPGIFVPYFLARRRYQPVLWCIAVGAAITVASLFVIPLSDYLRFPEVLTQSMYLAEGGITPGNLSMEATGRLLASLAGYSAESVRLAITAFRFLPYPILLVVTAREALDPPSIGISKLVPVLRLVQGFIVISFIMSKFWAHHLVLLLPCYFLGLHAVVVKRQRLVAAILAASTVIVCVVNHPVLYWDILGDPSMDGVREIIWEFDRLGLFLLFAGIELLIARLKRA